MIRWPGKIKAGSVSNEIVSGHDWIQTFLAAVGEPDMKENCSRATTPPARRSKSTSMALTNCPICSARPTRARGVGFSISTTTATSCPCAENWKSSSWSSVCQAPLVWAEPFTALRVPKLFDLRADPYERADITSNTYYDWFISQPYIVMAAQVVTASFSIRSSHFHPVSGPPVSASIKRSTNSNKA